MKKNLFYIIAFLLLANSFFASAQNNGYVFIEGVAKIPFIVAMDNTSFVQSTNNYVFFNNVTAGVHEFVVTMVSKGQNVKQNFSINNNNAQPIGMQLSINEKNEIIISKKEISDKEIIAKTTTADKPKKKNFLDKLLGENADGKDVKQFGLYKQGITDANQAQYALLQKNKLNTETENKAGKDNTIKEPNKIVEINITEVAKKETEAKQKIEKNKDLAKVEKNTALLNNNKENNVEKKQKKESAIKLIGDFFTERSRENDEVKINHPTKTKAKVLPKEVALAVIEDKTEPEINRKFVEVNQNLKALEEAKKQKINAEYEAKQLEINKMKSEKERLDAISISEKQQIEKEKFLLTQKKRLEAEKVIAYEKQIQLEAIEKEKQLALAKEAKIKLDAEIALQKKTAEAKAKAIVAENAKKMAADKLKLEKENAEKIAAEEQIKLTAANKLRIEKEAIQAKIKLQKEGEEEKERIAKEEAIAKKKALEENKIAAKKIKEQAEYAKKEELVEKTKALLAEKKRKEEIAEQAALDKAEAMAAEVKIKDDAKAAARLIKEQKEIDAKKELIAEQAKLTLAKLEMKKIEEGASIESAKKEASEWKAKYEVEQKAKLELEIRAQLTAEINARMEEERKTKESETMAANKALEKSKLTKLEKKVNKVANRPNPNCQALYNEDDLVGIFQKLESKIDDESRLHYSKKLLKDKKCFMCKDLEQLAQSYNTQTGKFGFLQAMFPFVQDNENYELLENVFKYESYKAKVRLEFGGEVAEKK
jgi:hypothetical protein